MDYDKDTFYLLTQPICNVLEDGYALLGESEDLEPRLRQPENVGIILGENVPPHIHIVSSEYIGLLDIKRTIKRIKVIED